MVLALHLDPLRSDEAAPETMKTLFFWLEIWLTASATPELGTSMIMSPLSTSHHWLASGDPRWGLFCGAPLMSTTFTFGLFLMKSATAGFAAATEPAPPMSE